MSEVIAYAWKLNLSARMKYPGFTETYTIDGQAPVKGQIFKNPNLANTLEGIAKNGRDYFYKGPIARDDCRLYETGGWLPCL